MTDPKDKPAGRVRDSALAYRTQAEDTSVWADRLLFEHLATLDARESLRMCTEACRTMDELLLVGLRRDHPGAEDDELEFRAAVLKYGAQVMEEFTGRRLSTP
ncbi:MAG: hypothetical protein JNL28_04660 [Planctomycetes bacterium]|nr:hypothetical protein [Planctomycetota bacterium]